MNLYLLQRLLHAVGILVFRLLFLLSPLLLFRFLKHSLPLLCPPHLLHHLSLEGGEISEVGLGVMVVAEGRVRWMELYGEADLATAVVRTRELARIHELP